MMKVICAAQDQTSEIRIAVMLTASLLVGMLALQAASGEAVQNDFRSICTAPWIVRHSSPEKRGHLYLICPVLLSFVFAALGLAREKATVGLGQPYPINT